MLEIPNSIDQLCKVWFIGVLNVPLFVDVNGIIDKNIINGYQTRLRWSPDAFDQKNYFSKLPEKGDFQIWIQLNVKK